MAHYALRLFETKVLRVAGQGLALLLSMTCANWRLYLRLPASYPSLGARLLDIPLPTGATYCRARPEAVTVEVQVGLVLRAVRLASGDLV